MSHPATDYFELAARHAGAYRDRVVDAYQPAVTVRLTVLGPDLQTRVYGGEATFPRCDADVYEGGILTVTSRDDGFVLREYPPGTWIDATVYDKYGQIEYGLLPSGRRA